MIERGIGYEFGFLPIAPGVKAHIILYGGEMTLMGLKKLIEILENSLDIYENEPEIPDCWPYLPADKESVGGKEMEG